MSTGGVFEFGEHAAKPRFQATLFARSEFFGNSKLRKAHQGFADVLQASLESSDGG